MGDINRLYSKEELEGLSDDAKREFQRELEKQLREAPEIDAILNAHQEASKALKRRMATILTRLRGG
jgi:hypothetical protein